jgi:hypothetical protein
MSVILFKNHLDQEFSLGEPVDVLVETTGRWAVDASLAHLEIPQVRLRDLDDPKSVCYVRVSEIRKKPARVRIDTHSIPVGRPGGGCMVDAEIFVDGQKSFTVVNTGGETFSQCDVSREVGYLKDLCEAIGQPVDVVHKSDHT